MKAKELIKILERNPECEVIMTQTKITNTGWGVEYIDLININLCEFS